MLTQQIRDLQDDARRCLADIVASGAILVRRVEYVDAYLRSTCDETRTVWVRGSCRTVRRERLDVTGMPTDAAESEWRAACLAVTDAAVVADMVAAIQLNCSLARTPRRARQLAELRAELHAATELLAAANQ